MQNLKLGFAFCGSFCTINKSLEALKELAKLDIDITPIMSEITYSTSTRFANADEFNKTVEAMSKMGFGEAGGCSHTEIAATFWNVLNRYDAKYAKSIYGVVTAKGQYHGYKTYHPVRDDIYELCIDVIARWVAEKEGASEVGRILPSDYFWFYGDGRHNHYRNVYKSSAKWDWSLPTPYAD